MAEVIRMPRMSDTMQEGVIVEWHKKVGDKVKPGDILAEVETDKATMDLESYQEGTLLYIGVEKGQAVPVEGVLAVLGEEGEDYKSLLDGDKGKNGSTAPAAKKEEKKGAEGENGKKESKSTVKEKETGAGEKVKVKESADKKEETEEEGEGEEESSGDGTRVKASPLARRMAADKGIDIKKVQGSGDDGRIIRRDIESFKVNKGTQGKPYSIQEVSGEEGYEEVTLSQMRKAIARRLSESKFGAPHFYLTMEINMEQAIKFRASLNEVTGVKVSFNDLVVKAAALAIRQNPHINGSWMGDKIRYNRHIHIGIAVAVEEGLMVPVIRFADNKPLPHIATEAKALGEKARNKKLQPNEFEGNTFTISNLGMLDIDEFTAIINPPDSCILAVGRIKEVPIVVDGQIRVGSIMKLTLSCDHRVVDGATGAKFLQSLKLYLEDPVRMVL